MKDWVLILATLLGVLVSGVAVYFAIDANRIARQALYVSEEAPFDPVLVASDPMWRVEKVLNSSARVALATTVLIANRGAQTGCIADLALLVKLPTTGEEKRFKPYQFLNSGRLFEVLRKQREFHEAYEAEFAPIFVLGKEQVVRTILFRSFTFPTDQLVAGKYTVSLAANECGNRGRWRDHFTVTVDVRKEAAARLLCGRTIVFESEERINAFEALRDRKVR